MKIIKILTVSFFVTILIYESAAANQCKEAYQRTLKKQRTFPSNSWQYHALGSYKKVIGDLFLDSRRNPHALKAYESNCRSIYNGNVLSVK